MTNIPGAPLLLRTLDFLRRALARSSVIDRELDGHAGNVTLENIAGT